MLENDEIITFVQELIKNSNVPEKSDFKKMYRVAKNTFQMTLNREEAKDRFLQYLKYETKSHIDGRKPILAIWGAPGSGKTHFLDEIMNLSYLEEHSKITSSEDAYLAREQYFPILCTFNSHTDFDSKGEPNIISATCLRILFS